MLVLVAGVQTNCKVLNRGRVRRVGFVVRQEYRIGHEVQLQENISGFEGMRESGVSDSWLLMINTYYCQEISNKVSRPQT